MKAILLILSFITVWLTACDDSVASSYDTSVDSTYSSSSAIEHGRYLNMSASSSSMSLYIGISSQRSRPGSMVIMGKVCDSLITKEARLHDYVPSMALSIMEDVCGRHQDTLKCNSVDDHLDKIYDRINEDMKDTIVSNLVKFYGHNDNDMDDTMAGFLSRQVFIYFTDKTGNMYYLYNWPCRY